MKVAQSCLTLCDPMDDTVHGILQARILEWVVIPYSRGSSQPRDWTQVSRIAGKTYFLGKYKFYQSVWSLFSVCLCEEKFLKYWMPENIFIMLSYMNDSLARNYILNSKFLFFKYSMLLHYLLASVLLLENKILFLHIWSVSFLWKF